MATAKKDGKPIVYIGFGSITVPNARQVTERIVKAVLKSKPNIFLIDGILSMFLTRCLFFMKAESALSSPKAGHPG